MVPCFAGTQGSAQEAGAPDGDDRGVHPHGDQKLSFAARCGSRTGLGTTEIGPRQRGRPEPAQHNRARTRTWRFNRSIALAGLAPTGRMAIFMMVTIPDTVMAMVMKNVALHHPRTAADWRSSPCSSP